MSEILHSIAPVCSPDSRILILGSFPSVRSREVGFFYGHPQNRFWKVLSLLFEESVPQSIDEKKHFLQAHGIALWDVIASCETEDSADVNIKNAVSNDLGIIFETANIQYVFTNGRLAHTLYEKHIGKNAVYLPSTSPANAAWTLERLTSAWKVIADHTIDMNSSI